MSNRTAHVALFDELADWEVGHLLAELRTGRFTRERFDVVTVADSLEPITTMGGVRMVPDAPVAELDPGDSDLLVLPGGDMWDAGGGDAFAAVARRFLAAGVPVAAICGATAGLARAGLLDDRHHTSAARSSTASCSPPAPSPPSSSPARPSHTSGWHPTTPSTPTNGSSTAATPAPSPR
jgi:putative intracellular protease/amidase